MWTALELKPRLQNERPVMDGLSCSWEDILKNFIFHCLGLWQNELQHIGYICLYIVGLQHHVHDAKYGVIL
jgi:hypothetical protein